jgi:hypothetical protein
VSAHTAINDLFGTAPAKRILYGDKKRKSEPTTHIIEFPGGAVELSRLEDGSYWVHVIVNRAPLYSSNDKGMSSAHGEVIDSRIDWGERRLEGIPCLPEGATLTQLAVQIRPVSLGSA